MVALIVVAVVLSASRAGVVSIAVMGGVWLFQRMSGKYWAWRYGMLIALVLLLICCYWIKKDSADGRLLIWRCSVEMAKEAPLLGHGLGCFEARYMDVQADYFAAQGTEGRYAMLADNVKHPFNEYLNVLLKFGLIGWGVLMGLTMWLIRCYRKHPCRQKRIVIYALLSIGTFSLFSYPFTYPFTWMVVLLCVGWLVKEPLRHLLGLPGVRYGVCAVVFVGVLTGTYKWAERVRAEWEWNKASSLALVGKYKEALPKYRLLKERLANNPYFLYNYAAILQESKLYAESLEVSLLCRRYWADYDLELIIGENHRYLGHPEEAVARYRRAALMCPSRFLPLYGLLHLYKESGDRRRMVEIADRIIAKPMKRKTLAILMMKMEAKREMSK